MNKEEIFYNATHNYFEEGIINEIYKDENIIVLNFLNHYYYGCPLKIIEEDKVIAFAFTAEQAKILLDDTTNIYKYINSMTTEKYENSIINFSKERVLEKSRTIQKRDKIQNFSQSNCIDKEWEEELKNKCNSLKM